jgi:hypothetical protein
MKINRVNHDDILRGIEETLEKETGQKIFTMRVMNDREQNNDIHLEVLVVFEDKSVLMNRIVVVTTDGKLALRMQGNFI